MSSPPRLSCLPVPAGILTILTIPTLTAALSGNVLEDPGKQMARILLHLLKGIRGNSPNNEHLGLMFSPKSIKRDFSVNSERQNLLQQAKTLPRPVVPIPW